MNCPSDGTTLLMSERQGIEIDYCPQCRGVWLDRGELDKILERAQAEAEALAASAAPTPAPQQAPPAQQFQQQAPAPRQTQQPYFGQPRVEDRRDDRYDSRRDDRYADRRDGSYDPRYNGRKKKKPFDFLGELFE
ncbi:Zn-finger nucleic acid-binding protein [Leucobacter exalbidus]|uniref:Zn-finger nucleic acid-binding protein n=1 Tax=Leucobacter exalbidus TaxID=662960 RepID=A0A940T3Z3_9MICO|nr:zf-TFIIB domain-containing protein [Leucobacter exalbidus]MBP1326313.1 Zn-finger nucleic acid-binding protein [Leucobacter exalbidus]